MTAHLTVAQSIAAVLQFSYDNHSSLAATKARLKVVHVVCISAVCLYEYSYL
jgi:hypothetical protein